MKQSCKNVLWVAFSVSVLAGCMAPKHLDSDLGKTLEANKQAQYQNPVTQSTAAAELDGLKSQQVMDTYRRDSGKADGERILTDMGSEDN